MVPALQPACFGRGLLETFSRAAPQVKNHSPFASTLGWGDRRRARGRAPEAEYRINDLGPMETIGAFHVPQLQLEMFCAGPQCRSALFVSCSATKGANIFRVERNDGYIHTMLQLLLVFVARYIVTRRQPPSNFFHADPPRGIWGDEPPPAAAEPNGAGGHDEYERFLHETVAIARNASLIRRVPQADVQRGPSESLFLG